ncbi:MAG: helix-turn-helix transcriptional regulator [Bacteroidia bacterium]
MEKQILIVIDETKLSALISKVDGLQVLVERILSEHNNQSGYVTEERAKEITGLSKSTLYKLRKAGRVASSSFGGRDVYYKSSDLETLLKENEKHL